MAAGLRRLAGGLRPAPSERLSWSAPRRTLITRPEGVGEPTRRLAERLGGDLEALERILEPDDAELWAQADPLNRHYLALAFSVHYGIPGALERTGLSAATPPEEVHAMGRGSLAAGGSYYYADLVAGALHAGGADLDAGGRGLDFGCSSGRVVRVLQAAYPEVEWHGCDPIPDAIEWAREHLPGIDFRLSPQQPPLPYPDGHFDHAYAISIWSHFGERAARAWLEEMRRILRPGALLLLTTQGHQSLDHFGSQRLWDIAELERAKDDLYAHGFCFYEAFGEGGDHGIKSSEWGMTWLSPDWLLANACPAWSVLAFEPGRAEGNQDVYVLGRR